MEKILYKGKELFSPKFDLVFKALFGKEESKELLRSFLNGVLDLQIKNVNEITLTNTEIVSDNADGKLSRLDVCAQIKTVGSDEHIDIEVQLSPDDDMMKRSVYYVSKLFSSQLKSGGIYSQLGKAIGLSILDFNLFDDDKWIHRGRLKDTETNDEFSDCFEVNFIEMKKLPKKINDVNDPRQLWLLFLNAKSEEDITMLAQQNSEIALAVDRLEKISTDVEFMHQALIREKTERDYYSAMAYAKQQGVLETAKKFLKMGLSVADIANGTGLSEDVIKKLR